MRSLLSPSGSLLAVLFVENRLVAPALAFSAALIVLSCGGGGGDKSPTDPPPPVPLLTTVTVSFSSATIQVGQTATANAIGFDQNGASIGTGTVTWTSSSSAVATISPSGAITAFTAGQTQITASVGTRSGQATLTVTPAPVASVTVSPATASIIIGVSKQLTATTLDANNAVLSGRTITWSSSDTTKVRVNTAGLVTAVALGGATITATSEGKSGTMVATVMPPPGANITVNLGFTSLMPGQTTAAEAVFRDAAGGVVAGRSFTWSSSDTTVATVAASGFVVAFNSGTVTISASSEGTSGATQLAVQAIPTAPAIPVVEFSPAVYSLSEGTGLSVILDATAASDATWRATTWNAPAVPFRRLQNSARFVVVLSRADVLAACSSQQGRSECAVGTITLTGAAALPIVAVPLAVTSTVIVTALAADVQRSDYIVNLRYDGLRQSDGGQNITRKFFQYFGDVFDYLALGEIASTNGSVSFQVVRRTETGLGAPLADNSAIFGASKGGRLHGLINFRNYFDLAHQVTSHEMAHAFGCYLSNVLSCSGGHWPLATTAFAILGSNGNPGANSGDRKVVPLGDGTYRLDPQSPYGGFNNLELYLMGLADSSEVENQVVFQDQAQSTAVGAVLRGPVTTVSIRDIATANGLRTPGWAGTPVTFRMATIVVSRGRMLTAAEMAYYDARARRGEATTRFDDGYGAPFYVNTRGRGVLVTRIP